MFSVFVQTLMHHASNMFLCYAKGDWLNKSDAGWKWTLIVVQPWKFLQRLHKWFWLHILRIRWTNRWKKMRSQQRVQMVQIPHFDKSLGKVIYQSLKSSTCINIRWTTTTLTPYGHLSGDCTHWVRAAWTAFWSSQIRELATTLHFWLRSIKDGQFRLINFASHFIRVKIFR